MLGYEHLCLYNSVGFYTYAGNYVKMWLLRKNTWNWERLPRFRRNGTLDRVEILLGLDIPSVHFIVFHLSKKESKTPQMGDLEIDIHDFQIFSFSPFDKLQLQFMGRMI